MSGMDFNSSGKQILVFKFEEIIADKPKEISRLIKFLGIKDANISEIVEKVRKLDKQRLSYVLRVISKRQERIDRKKRRRTASLSSKGLFSEKAVRRDGKKNFQKKQLPFTNPC